MTSRDVNVKRLSSRIRIPSVRKREIDGCFQLCLMNLRAMSVASGTLSSLLWHWKLKERLSSTGLGGPDCNLHSLPTVSGAPLRLTTKLPVVIIPVEDERAG
jgi:hypothetical protein